MKSPIEQYAEVEAMKKVDVMVAMEDAAHSMFMAQYKEERNNLLKAMDIVSELIEAKREFEQAMSDYNTTAPAYRGKKWPVVQMARIRLDRALDRIA